MLQRVSRPTTAPYLPRRWGDWRSDAAAEQISTLLRYIAVLAVVCGIGCTYLWQRTTIADVDRTTYQMQVRVEALEAENAALMQQLSQWHSPAYIAEQGRALGVIQRPVPLVIPMPGSQTGDAPVTTNARPSLFERFSTVVRGLQAELSTGLVAASLR